MILKLRMGSGKSFCGRPELALCALLALTASLGCGRSREVSAESVLPRAAVRVDASVLREYVGVYRLPSGALLKVVIDNDRLWAGAPPAELIPLSTRSFTSSRFFAELHFERNAGEPAQRVDYRIAKRSHWCPRVDEVDQVDPTQLVDAGGHRLRMLTLGRGGPTIVLEDGFGNCIEMQASLQAALSQVARVVAYDHAGTGGSDLGPEPRDGRQVAHELRTALGNAGLAPPFVLVGGSIGADYCRIFAGEFPADTAGLVLLDPTPDWDEMLTWAETHAPKRVERYRQMRTEANATMDVLMEQQEPSRRAEWVNLETTRAQARLALPGIVAPTVQLTGASGRRFSSFVDDKVRFFDAWLAAHTPDAAHVLANNSCHAVSITDQDLIVEQVRALIASANASRLRDKQQ